MSSDLLKEKLYSSTRECFMQNQEYALSSNTRPTKVNMIEPSVRQTLFPAIFNKD